tara:strand:- start:104 stop:718 length:615 start_codon:yes stop_codon:yes gene_type:complete
MVFFLGRDITVFISTENATLGCGINATTGALFTTATDADATFATDLAGGGTAQGKVTGCEVGIGAMDEDITYYGMRSVTKAEIKKETTFSLTRKKSNNEYDGMFSEARYGITGTNTGWAGLEQPNAGDPTTGATAFTHGYRIHIFMEGRNGTDEVISIPYCTITGHTVTINTDGTQDETLEFSTMVAPVYQSTKYVDAVTATNI